MIKHIIALAIMAISLSCPVNANELAAKQQLPHNKLTSWVHIFGCPTSTKGHMGKQDIVLIFDDGETVALDLSKMSTNKIADLTKYISKVLGYNFVAKCGEK